MDTSVLSPTVRAHIVAELTNKGPAIAHPEMLADAGEQVDRVAFLMADAVTYPAWKRAVGFWLAEVGLRLLRQNDTPPEVLAVLRGRWLP